MKEIEKRQLILLKSIDDRLKDAGYKNEIEKKADTIKNKEICFCNKDELWKRYKSLEHIDDIELRDEKDSGVKEFFISLAIAVSITADIMTTILCCVFLG